MTASLRIAIAEDDPDHLELLRRALTRLGHQVVGAADSGAGLVELCRSCSPQLVITDICMPDMDGLEAAAQICESGPVPLIVVTSHHDQQMVERAGQQCILAFLVKPVAEENLAPTIAIAMSRFQEFESLKEENATLAQALEDRKLIERAKGLLMSQAGIDEGAAFKRLQSLAREQRKKMAEVAQMIVVAADAMRPS